MRIKNNFMQYIPYINVNNFCRIGKKILHFLFFCGDLQIIKKFRFNHCMSGLAVASTAFFLHLTAHTGARQGRRSLQSSMKPCKNQNRLSTIVQGQCELRPYILYNTKAPDLPKKAGGLLICS